MALSRKRTILDGKGREYMIRYHLLFREKANAFEKNADVPFNLFFHKIILSDDPILHDHPWSYFTVILKGGYYEHTPKGKFWRGPGYMTYRKAHELHYLELKENMPCYTLFWHGKRERDWGFIDPQTNNWIYYKDFLTQRDGLAKNV